MYSPTITFAATLVQGNYKVYPLLAGRELSIGNGNNLPNLTVLCDDPVGGVSPIYAGTGRLLSLCAGRAGLCMTGFMQNSLTRHLISPGGKNDFTECVFILLFI